MKTARELLRNGRLQRTSRTTRDLKYSEVNCQRSVETRETAANTGVSTFIQVDFQIPTVEKAERFH